MRKEIAFLVLLLFVFIQQNIAGDKIQKKNYRSAENIHYWKNRSPRADYWQQDVKYEIYAKLNDTTGIISGDSYKLTYYNNSPFALTEIYFHLNENAFQPGSYYDNLTNNNHVKTKFGKYEAAGLGTQVNDLLINGAAPKSITLDNTIMQVKLNAALLPNDSIVITCNFKTYFDTGTMRRRNKTFETFGTKHYDGVHWYPQICVYDAKFGWTTDQHLDKEFYNNFGTFDIHLNMPNDYVVEATGELCNFDEVYPDSLRRRLDISNFNKKGLSTPPSVITPRVNGVNKTWNFYAINVHNFAFTADPLYRLGETEWNGIKCITIVQEPNAGRWQQSADWAARVIKTYSLDFGMYIWPKIVVADAKDGMEYPMLTLDGGTYPQHQSLLAHEIGHMWFYGMLGSNETYRASMDEGFTQFATTWSMDKLVGAERERLAKPEFVEKRLAPLINRYDNLYYPYLKTVDIGYDEPLNTHSSGFNGAIRHGGSYGLVYYKTGTMLYNLRYVLGDTLFQNAMKHYVSKWKICHPYPEDFRQAIIEYTQVDLNWFFDEWMETTKNIDYKIKSVKETEKGKYAITLKRKGRMQMPIDISVTSNGKTYKYLIPNTWFAKSDSGITVLPKWYGWDLLEPTYTFTAEVPAKPTLVQIDPTHMLADLDLSNNVKGKFNGDSWGKKWQFDHRVPTTSSWTTWQHYWRPDLWYNKYDGVQAGLHLHGNYFQKKQYSITAWYNTRAGQYEIPEAFKTRNQPFAVSTWASIVQKRTTYKAAFIYNAGLIKPGVYVEKIFQKQDARNPRSWVANVSMEMMYRPNTQDALYPVYQNLWSIQRLNSYADLGLTRNIGYTNGYLKMTVSGRIPGVASKFNYSKVGFNIIHKHNWKKFEINNRLFGQYGFGKMPLESSLYLAGANPEEMYGNKYTRAAGIVPTDWTTFGNSNNHFQAGGGLNLRGYAGYVNPVSGQNLYYGRTGMSISSEIDFDKYISIKPRKYTKYFHLDTYVFGDAGVLAISQDNAGIKTAPILVDAGLGTALNIKFSPLDIKPLVIRFDMPFFLNQPAANDNMLKWRYVVGINRAF